MVRKVDLSPLDPLFQIVTLLFDKHEVVEELLEFLIGVVDAELFERVLLDDFEAGDVQNSNETTVSAV